MPNAPATRTPERVQVRRRRHGRTTMASTIVAPHTRNQATLCGGSSSNRSYAIAAPAYIAMPPVTKHNGAVRAEIGAVRTARTVYLRDGGARQPTPVAQRVD